MFVKNVIIGAGLSGSTIARLLADRGESVMVVDKRNHIAGNVYDFYDENDILIQKYGPHIFHTNNKAVWEFLSRFTEWNNYQHKVLAFVEGKFVPVPINLSTVNTLYGTNYNSEEVKAFFDSVKSNIPEIKNSKDVIVSQVGEDLYKKIFKNYTKKQWGVYPDELSPEVTSRVPVRVNDDDRYFTDEFQGMPVTGFSKLVKNMLNHENIKVLLNTDHKDIKKDISYTRLFFTGCIDEFFSYKFGKLPYRCLEFRFEKVNTEFFQSAAVVNYPNDHEFTRITEFKHWTFQKRDKTTIVKEFSRPEGDPYYPVPQKENYELCEKYAQEAKKLERVYFAGRLGKYRYFNMDKVVEDSMELVAELCE